MFVIHKLAEALNDKSKSIRGSKLCVLGVAYKKDVVDPRIVKHTPLIVDTPSATALLSLLAGVAAIGPYLFRTDSAFEFDRARWIEWHCLSEIHDGAQ